MTDFSDSAHMAREALDSINEQATVPVGWIVYDARWHVVRAGGPLVFKINAIAPTGHRVVAQGSTVVYAFCELQSAIDQLAQHQGPNA